MLPQVVSVDLTKEKLLKSLPFLKIAFVDETRKEFSKVQKHDAVRRCRDMIVNLLQRKTQTCCLKRSF